LQDPTSRTNEGKRPTPDFAQGLFEAANDGLFVADAETGVLIEVNRRAEQLTGRPAEDLVGQPQTILHPPEEAERYQAIFRNHIKAGTAISEEIFVQRPGGERIPVEISASLVRWDDRTVVLGIFRDLSERRGAEKAIETFKTRFLSLYENLRDGVAVIDRNGLIIGGNPAFLAMTGYSREELGERTYRDLTPERWHAAEEEIVKTQVSKRGFSDLYEKECIHGDGSIFPVEVRSYLIKDGQGQPDGMWSFVRDITKRKQVQEQLRETSEKYRLLLENIPDIIFTLGPKGHITAINEAGRRLLGFREAEIVGQHFQAVVHPEDRRRAMRLFNEAIASRREMRRGIDLRLVDSRRGTLWVSLNANMAFDKHGQCVQTQGVARDVTARKLAEDRRAESEERARSVVSFSPMGIHMYRLERGERLVFTGANAAADRILQMPHENLVGKDIEDAFPGLVPTEIPDRYRDVCRTGTPWTTDSFEYEDDRIRGAYEVQAYRTGPDAIAVNFQDVTERKRMEKALRDREAQLHSILESLPFDVFALDESGRYFLQNTLCKRYWGEVIGKRPEDLPVDEETLALWRKNNRRAFAGETVSEDVSFPIDGTLFHFHNILSPIRDGDEIRGIVGINIDITARKRAEEALQFTQFSVDQSAEATYWVDPDARFTYVNEAGCRMLGYSRGELLAMTIHDIDPDFPRSAWEAHWRQIKKEKTLNMESRGRAKDGRTFPVEMTINYLEYEGHEFNCAFIRDISDIKRASAEREALIDELEEKNAELERFSYTVSHDLKTPLITIMGFLDLLLRDLKRGERDGAEARVAKVKGAAEKMHRMIEELLELSRIGRTDAKAEAVDLGEAAREAAELVAGPIHERGVIVEVQPGMPTIQGEPARIIELFHNLIDNAVKFMGDQKEPAVSVGIETRRGEPFLFVRDNGVGVSPPYQEKIFGLFNKLDPEARGSGVGLAVVKRIIETHGGTIWIESETGGGGTTFCFTLPGIRLDAKGRGDP